MLSLQKYTFSHNKINNKQVYTYLVVIGNIHYKFLKFAGRTVTILHCPVEVYLHTLS